MKDEHLLEFIELYNNSEDKPQTALEWILFIYNNGFNIYKKNAL